MDILVDTYVDFDIDSHMYNINKTVEAVLDLENFTKNVEVSIVFVDNNEIKKINKRFRNIDKPTDVLSFPLLDGSELKDNEVVMLGDIIISVDKVYEQANEYNHSETREVAFLVAHSMLHLLGYDHMDYEEEKIMIEKQKKVMEIVNILR